MYYCKQDVEIIYHINQILDILRLAQLINIYKKEILIYLFNIFNNFNIMLNLIDIIYVIIIIKVNLDTHTYDYKNHKVYHIKFDVVQLILFGIYY